MSPTYLIVMSLFSIDTIPVYPQVTISSTRSLMLSLVALFIWKQSRCQVKLSCIVSLFSKGNNQKSNCASHMIMRLMQILIFLKDVFILSISCDRSKSVTSLADTCMLSESPEQRYLKHHSRIKLGQGPPCARLAAMTSPALLTKTKHSI